MNDIRKKLEPAILAFTKSLDSVKDDIIGNRDETDKQLKIVQEQNATLKERISESNQHIKEGHEKVNSEVERYKALQIELQDEIARNKSALEDIEKTRRKTADALKTIEGEKTLIEQLRTRMEDAVKKYNDKSNALLKDFDILAKKSEDLANRENNVKGKEKALIRQEEKNIEYSRQISIREIDVRQKEERIKIEMKRSKING